MSDNNDVNSANGQYSGDLFGFSGDYLNTNAPGTSAPAEPARDNAGALGQLGGGIPGGFDITSDDVTNTHAPGSVGGSPPRDGGTVTVTNGGRAGIPDGTMSGGTNTNFEALAEPFTHKNSTDTGIGSGSPTHSDAGGHDQSAPWTGAGE